MTEALALPQVSGRLPAEVTTFVGRRFERRAIRELLQQSRLVTLTGFGGVGKTRLALRLATELRRVQPDGVCFVSLGAVGDADDVPDQVAAALGLYGRSTQTGMVAIVDYLRTRRMLLVLDNCEHVVDVVALMSDRLLRDCPGARILATSREALRVEGEVVHPIPPLTVPATGEHGEGGLHQYEAVQLFLDRARASDPGFALTDSNRGAVAAICRRLEGIPLALELAAARLPTLSAAELERGLTDQWELLSRGRRGAPHRQSTMAACIEWSFELCSPAERRLWARAAVFVDGFERDAAVAVCSEPGEEPVEETLASLVEKSVLGTTRHDGTTRFRMLPPIRQRGLAELARIDAAGEVRIRHREFTVRLVERARDEWLSDAQLHWIHRLRREGGNIAAALEDCAADPAAVDAGRTACGHLLEYVMVHGLFRQGRRWCDRLLAEGGGDRTARALALRSACWWAALQGDIPTAASLLEEGRALANEVGGETEVLLTETAGLVAMYAGQRELAEQLINEAITGFTGSGNAAELAHCWMLLAILNAVWGDPEGALEHHRRCLAITEPAGETWIRSWSSWAAGLADWALDDVASAERRVKESLRLEHLMGERLGVGAAMEVLGWLAATTDPARTAALMGAAQNQWDLIETSIQTMAGLDVPHDEATATARSALGAEAFEQALSAGRALHEDRAIALALEDRPVPPAPLSVTPTGLDVLTRRERQIAELVRQGLGNREIAETLVISPRTVEAHVQHILTKLGFTNRIQVAVWLGDSAGTDDS